MSSSHVHIRSATVDHRLCGSVDAQLQLIVVAPRDSKRIVKQTVRIQLANTAGAPRSAAPQPVAGTTEGPFYIMCWPIFHTCAATCEFTSLRVRTEHPNSKRFLQPSTQPLRLFPACQRIDLTLWIMSWKLHFSHHSD